MLSAHAGDNRLANRVGTDLPGQVHLHRGVDCHGTRVLTDILRIVGPRHIAYDKVGIAVHMVVQVPRTENQATDRLAGIQGFLRIVDYTPLYQRQYAIGDSLGMQAEVLVTTQGVDNRIRYAAYANLERGTVGDLLGNVATDLRLNLIRHRRRHFHQRFVATAHSADLRHMNNRVAERAGHILVDLSNHHTRTLHSRESDIGRDTVGAITVLVRLGYIQKRHIHRHLSAAKQKRHFAQETWNSIRHTFFHRTAQIVRHEDRQRTERVNILGFGIRCIFRTNAKTYNDLDITQFGSAFGERTEQDIGH